MIIEENTVCYTSEIGHNNFWYPSQNKVITKQECEAHIMSWISGGSKMAIKILKSYLMPLDITENTTKNISPPTENSYTVVWIERCFKK
jgi:hypothetical protein